MKIPALVVRVNDEDAFIMSLTENIARRKYSALELLMSIEQLSQQGYDGEVASTTPALHATRPHLRNLNLCL